MAARKSRKTQPAKSKSPKSKKKAPFREQEQLARILAEDRERRGWAVVHKADELGMDRRKLGDLMKKQARSITFKELHSIAGELAQSGVPLSQIFDNPSLIGALAKSRRVALLFGAKPERPGPGTSWWDLRSLADTIQILNNATIGSGSWELYDVLQAEEPEKLKNGGHEALFEDDPWRGLLEEDSEFSVISFGSPLANHASEVMLADMFDVPPFSPDVTGVPFQYIWEDTRFDEMPSSFATRGSQRPRAEVASMTAEWKVWGMDIRGQSHMIDRKQNPSTTYGIIAAQRRPGGQIWVVVSGATGPGTYAASRMLVGYPEPDDEEQGSASRTIWLPIRASDRGRETRKAQTVFNEGELYPGKGVFFWPE